MRSFRKKKKKNKKDNAGSVHSTPKFKQKPQVTQPSSEPAKDKIIKDKGASSKFDDFPLTEYAP